MKPKNARTITEEVFNSVIHGLGVMAGVVGLFIGYITLAAPAAYKIGFLVYCTSLIMLMLASTLYHALTFTRARKVFSILDHSSIYLLIAGSFTPFAIKLFSGWGLALLLVAIWAFAILGVVTKAALPGFAKKIGVVPYIIFGWVGLIFIPKMHLIQAAAINLLIIGGVLYTIGVVLLVSKKPFMHAGWHVFVVAAAVAHFVAIIKLA